MAENPQRDRIQADVAAPGSFLITSAIYLYNIAYNQENALERFEEFEIIPTVTVPSEGTYAAVEAWTANLFYNEFVIAGTFTLAAVVGGAILIAWVADISGSNAGGRSD